MMEEVELRGADDGTNERPARARPRLALALASVAVLMACAYVIHALLVSPRSTATKGISEPASAPVLHTRSLEKATGDGCKLAMFIPMTACKKDITSAGCCSALRTILNAGCICKYAPIFARAFFPSTTPQFVRRGAGCARLIYRSKVLMPCQLNLSPSTSNL